MLSFALTIKTLLALTVILDSGLFLFLCTRKNKTRNHYFLIIHLLGVLIWALSILILLKTGSALVTSISFAAALLLAIGKYYFTLTFPEEVKLRTPKNYFLLTLAGFTLIFSFIPGLFFTDVSIIDGYYVKVSDGPYAPFYALVIMYFLVSPIVLLLRKAHSRKKRYQYHVRQQLFYLAYGVTFFFILGFATNSALPVFFEVHQFNGLGPVFSLILSGLIVYIITRHQFLDIRIIIQRGLVYTILFSFIALIFWSVVHIIGGLLPPDGQSYIHNVSHMISGIIATLISTFSIPLLDQWLRQKTDRFFFKDTYDYADGLRELSGSVNQNIKLENITKTSSAALQEILRAKNVRIEEIDHCGVTTLPVNQVPAKTLNVPIQHKNAWIGCIEIGEKLSGDQYTARDLSLIETFANQIATAFEKARLYKEVEDYSRTLEERVAARTAEIEALQENRNQIMLDISHQLQTPLTVVKNSIHSLKDDQPSSPHIKAFEKSIDDVSQFIYQMLHLATLKENNTQKIHLNLSQLMTELVEYYNVICLNKNIALKSNITSGIYIYADKKQLEEAITSIVSNAVKYMHPIDSGRQRCIAITLVQQDRTCEIIINDTGVGIATHALPHVFDRFYREKDGTRNISGNGLGLAITDKIIQLHDGTIGVTSIKGSGSTFSINLPTRRNT